MRRFLVTGQKYTGEAELLYNEVGTIEAVNLRNTSLNPTQRATFLQNIPAAETGLDGAFNGKLTIVEADIEETFEMFFNAFANKRNKQDALKLWNRLNLTDKVRCRLRIKAYFKYISRMHQGGFQIKQMYPDTWIRGRHWEDEWETAK